MHLTDQPALCASHWKAVPTATVGWPKVLSSCCHNSLWCSSWREPLAAAWLTSSSAVKGPNWGRLANNDACAHWKNSDQHTESLFAQIKDASESWTESERISETLACLQQCEDTRGVKLPGSIKFQVVKQWPEHARSETPGYTLCTPSGY